MHRGVPGVRDPGLLVDHGKPPVALTGACEMIEPRHRTIVDVEGQALVGLTAERQTDGGLDRSAMAHGNDVLAGLVEVDPVDRPADAVIEVHEAFAARRGFADVGKPVAADRTAGDECRAIHALPFPEILFGESRYPGHGRRPRKARGPDRVRGLVGALEIARKPDRTARQDLCDGLEHLAIAGVAVDILLAIDVAAVAAHRRVTHPPPPRRNDFRFVWIGHRRYPSILFDVAVRESAHRLK